jgi:hypothetical protein
MQPRLHTGRSPRAAVLAPNITCILDKILDRGWHRGGIGGAKEVHRGGSNSLTRAPPFHGPVGAWDVALGGLRSAEDERPRLGGARSAHAKVA